MSFGTITLRNCAFNQVSKKAYDLSVSTLQDRSGRAFFRVGEMTTKDGRIVPVAAPIKTKDGGSVMMVQLKPCDPTTVTSGEHFKNLVDRGMIIVVKDGRIQKYPGIFGKVGTLGSYTLEVSSTQAYVMNFPGGCGILNEPAKDETTDYLKKTFAPLFNVEERKEAASIPPSIISRPPSTPRAPSTPPVAKGAPTVKSA